MSDLMVMSSNCEQAIRKAQGEPTEQAKYTCFGCTNSKVPGAHADWFHLYKACPQKSNPEILQNARKAMVEFFYREPTTGKAVTFDRATQARTNWSDEGFPSPGAA